jgi:hypothetical protein
LHPCLATSPFAFESSGKRVNALWISLLPNALVAVGFENETGRLRGPFVQAEPGV